jgi:hypothetical protein
VVLASPGGVNPESTLVPTGQQPGQRIIASVTRCAAAIDRVDDEVGVAQVLELYRRLCHERTLRAKPELDTVGADLAQVAHDVVIVSVMV